MNNCPICGPGFVGVCRHRSAETGRVNPLAINKSLEKEIDRLLSNENKEPKLIDVGELQEQNRLMIEALDKINSLGFDELHEAPVIAADVLDIINPVEVK